MPKPKADKLSTDDKHLRTAEAAFEKVRPRLDAIPASETEMVRIDLQAAAMQALRVAQMLAEPDAQAQVAAIAALGLVDIALIDGLEDVAWATWFARHNALQANATLAEAALPPALVEQSTELRGRMRKALAYYLDGDVQAMAEIATVRAGGVYLDLANDLAAAAAMYRKHDRALKDDPKNYRSTDAHEAVRLSERILRMLGAVTTPEQTLWKLYCARACKLLFSHYEEAIRVGRFFSHYDDPEGLFPSLYTATRAAPKRSAKKAGGVPDDTKSETGAAGA
jgi:hypothetical protein